MTATMKTTLVAVIKNGKLRNDNLSRAEGAFLKRWAESSADDPIWAKIVADARALNGWQIKQLYLELIWYAREARRVAISVKDEGVDPILRAERQERATLLALADKAADLAQYFVEAEKHLGTAEFFHSNLTLPVAPEQEAVVRIESVFRRVQQLQYIHKRLAQLLRNRAGREPKPRTFISRDRRKRDINAFVHLMTLYMEDFCGKRYGSAIGLLASDAFNTLVDAEDVRKTLGPSTRKLRALSRKNTT
jgi:hypothetical protein